MRILDREDRWFERGVKETIHVKVERPSLNTREYHLLWHAYYVVNLSHVTSTCADHETVAGVHLPVTSCVSTTEDGVSMNTRKDLFL